MICIIYIVTPIASFVADPQNRRKILIPPQKKRNESTNAYAWLMFVSSVAGRLGFFWYSMGNEEGDKT